MTVQDLRGLLAAYQEQQWLATNPTGGDDIDSFVAAAHGEKRAWHECAAAAVDALPQLLDIADAAADLRARAGVAATAQPQWTEPADVLRRIDQALERLGRHRDAPDHAPASRPALAASPRHSHRRPGAPALGAAPEARPRRAVRPPGKASPARDAQDHRGWAPRPRRPHRPAGGDTVTGPTLCYIEEPWAWFSTRPPTEEWGDDWNDAPYESNAGRPYGRDASLTRVAYEHPAYQTPAGQPRGWTVEQINRCDVPWLEAPGLPPIWAGCQLGEFIALIEPTGGQVWRLEPPSAANRIAAEAP